MALIWGYGVELWGVANEPWPEWQLPVCEARGSRGAGLSSAF